MNEDESRLLDMSFTESGRGVGEPQRITNAHADRRTNACKVLLGTCDVYESWPAIGIVDPIVADRWLRVRPFLGSGRRSDWAMSLLCAHRSLRNMLMTGQVGYVGLER